MNIHSLCLVKDEADIIEQSLTAAMRWSDFIYVYDNGSTDGTWEIVQSVARTHPKLIPYKQNAKPYSNALRGEAFRFYRRNAKRGDWWCLLDSDEFYVDDPRDFLYAVPSPYLAVWKSDFSYYFTDRDAEAFERSPALYGDNVPVEDKIRYYINNWSELRFVKESRWLNWPEDRPLDKRLPVYPKRIRVKHFQYRSPPQILRRINIRLNCEDGFLHEKQREWAKTILDPAAMSKTGLQGHGPLLWQSRLVAADKLHHDNHDGVLVGNENALPALPQTTFADLCLGSINGCLQRRDYVGAARGSLALVLRNPALFLRLMVGRTSRALGFN